MMNSGVCAVVVCTVGRYGRVTRQVLKQLNLCLCSVSLQRIARGHHIGTKVRSTSSRYLLNQVPRYAVRTYLLLCSHHCRHTPHTTHPNRDTLINSRVTRRVMMYGVCRVSRLLRRHDWWVVVSPPLAWGFFCGGVHELGVTSNPHFALRAYRWPDRV
jgi:hypothetical protein